MPNPSYRELVNRALEAQGSLPMDNMHETAMCDEGELNGCLPITVARRIIERRQRDAYVMFDDDGY